uniref:Uncharacterized protein n=1 Tax=Mycena chlorophos TaxID=658473 RepID=A0ABQ0LJX4_MYCCL|nr:predicted protein [Mycena chlorophos]
MPGWPSRVLAPRTNSISQASSPPRSIEIPQTCLPSPPTTPAPSSSPPLPDIIGPLCWFRLLHPLPRAPAGLWILSNGTSYYITPDSATTSTPQIPWPSSVPLQQFCDPSAVLTPIDLRQWPLDAPALRFAYLAPTGLAIAPGARVVLRDLPSYMATLLDAYVLDFPSPATARLRTAIRGAPLCHLHDSLLHDLASPLHDDDVVWLPAHKLRLHVSASSPPPKVGDRVETASHVSPYSSGFVESAATTTTSPLVLYRDALDGTARRAPPADLQRCFARHDSVVVHAGSYAGCRANVSRLISFSAQLAPSTPTTAGLVLKIEVQVLAPWVTLAPIVSDASLLPVAAVLPRPPPIAESWLCMPSLVGKRLDVRVFLRNVSPHDALRLAKTGYIELEHPLRPNQLDSTVVLHLDRSSCRIKVAARSLRPITEWLDPTCDRITTIAESPVRVIIIGPDVDGCMDHVGDYALVMADGAKSPVVLLKFARPSTQCWIVTRRYPLHSLCRALNVDGRKSKSTRFY